MNIHKLEIQISTVFIISNYLVTLVLVILLILLIITNITISNYY